MGTGQHDQCIDRAVELDIWFYSQIFQHFAKPQLIISATGGASTENGAITICQRKEAHCSGFTPFSDTMPGGCLKMTFRGYLIVSDETFEQRTVVYTSS